MISAVSAPFMPSMRPPAPSGTDRATASVETKSPSKTLPKTTPKIPSDTDARAPGQLTPEEKAVVEQLKKTDQEVRAHEQAHKNAGGKFAGSASYGYQAGPDGKRYAVSGEVPIDIAPVDGDPEATIAKMTIVSSAALAPAKPSGQDRQVAAQAASIRAEAQAELARQSRNELSGEEGGASESPNSGTISALSAYEAGRVSGNNETTSGQVLDFFS